MFWSAFQHALFHVIINKICKFYHFELYKHLNNSSVRGQMLTHQGLLAIIQIMLSEDTCRMDDFEIILCWTGCALTSLKASEKYKEAKQ